MTIGLENERQKYTYSTGSQPEPLLQIATLSFVPSEI